MKLLKNMLVVVVVLVLSLIAVWVYWPRLVDQQSMPPVADQLISDGTITVTYVPGEFGFAVSPEQVLVSSSIPPCDPSFLYCFYYRGDEYEGTNFDSAGFRIETRADLPTEGQCLATPPEGYTNMTPTIATSTVYARSTFAPVGDAGAGHAAVGKLYRLWTAGTCYEFETRIGTSQFANYPAGTVREFTEADRTAMEGKLEQFLKNLSLQGGVKPL